MRIFFYFTGMESEVVTKGSKRLKLSPNKAELDEEIKQDVGEEIKLGKSSGDTTPDEQTAETKKEAK